MIENADVKYSVGALLYSPALSDKVAGSVIRGSFAAPYSLSLCLEDTVPDEQVEAAEHTVVGTLRQIYEAYQTRPFYLPKLFIRVRSPEQIGRLFARVKPYQRVLTGFVLPKYTVSNAQGYNDAIAEANSLAGHKLYMMPILESRDLVDPYERRETLHAIRSYVDAVRDMVLNVRVGGNDFCNQLAARRHYDETIYDIVPVAQILGDILAAFSRDYVVSGPVWEYFSSDHNEWRIGLQKEIRRDMLNGFVGKTVIHPKQVPVVNEMLKVTKKDYEDARSILHWESGSLQVGKSFGGERMNEVRTHGNWARKTMLLAELYGVV